MLLVSVHSIYSVVLVAVQCTPIYSVLLVAVHQFTVCKQQGIETGFTSLPHQRRPQRTTSGTGSWHLGERRQQFE